MSERDEISLEKFYVYRSLQNDESWGALLLGSRLAEKLPNLDFGMRIFASNSKEAISKAKVIYDRIHVYDSDKENIRRFAAAALKSCISRFNDDAPRIAKESMKYAIALLEEYNKHFNKLETENE